MTVAAALATTKYWHRVETLASCYIYGRGWETGVKMKRLGKKAQSTKFDATKLISKKKCISLEKKQNVNLNIRSSIIILKKGENMQNKFFQNVDLFKKVFPLQHASRFWLRIIISSFCDT